MIERMRVSEIFREYGIYAVLALLVVGFSIVAPGFASVTNFILILLQVSVMGILSIGMLFVILSRGIDLSVGSILAVSGMFAGLLAKQELTFVNVALAFIAPIALGLLCGMFNGALVAWVRLPALIVTLGTMYAFRGFIVWYHVNPIYQLQPWFRVLGQGKIGPIPIPVIILLVMTLVRQCSSTELVSAATSTQSVATRMRPEPQGINVKLVKLGVYSISGFFCGLAGLVFTSRLGAAQSISGIGFELVAIASVVVGGASLFGGRGTVGKTLVGALIMQVVQSGLVMLDVPSPIQQATLGFIIIIAVGVDLFVQTKRNNAKFSVAIREFFSGQ